MVSDDHLLVTEQPFLKIPTTDTDGFPLPFSSIFNNSIFPEDYNFPMHDELASKDDNQNKVRAPQWKLQFPTSSSLMGFLGRKVRSGKEKKKDVDVNVRYEDENATVTSCTVSVDGEERTVITNLPATKNHKSDHHKKPKIRILGRKNATKSKNEKTLQQLPSETDPPKEDESMKSFLKESRAFHGSPIVSESLKGAFFDPSVSPLKKTELNTDYSLSHRILAVGVTGAVLLFPFVVKFFDD